MNERKPVTGEVQQVVLCRMLKPQALRTIEKCQECHQFGGMQEISPAQNGFPAQNQITCKLPSLVLVANLIKEA